MKFAVQSRGDATSNKIQSKIKNYLTEFNLEHNEEEPDLVISVGGMQH